jgi:hypothetical protein
MITDSNQACMAKKIGRRVQEVLCFFPENFARLPNLTQPPPYKVRIGVSAATYLLVLEREVANGIEKHLRLFKWKCLSFFSPDRLHQRYRIREYN